MSEDSGGSRRPGRANGDDDARPVTAAGRRRRAKDSSGGSRAAEGKGAPTPSRGRASTTTQESAVARLQRFLREVVAELRKVHWPTRRQIVIYTIVVLVFVAFMVSLVSLLDYAFAKAVFALFG